MVNPIKEIEEDMSNPKSGKDIFNLFGYLKKDFHSQVKKELKLWESAEFY